MALRILVVDDSVPDRRVVRSIFTRDPAFAGYDVDVSEAGDGNVGLDTFDRFKPHLIVCDLLMPKKDGFAFCKELRASLEGRDVPLMVVSGVYKDKRSSLELQKQYNAELFNKPIDPKYFARRAHELLLNYQREHPKLTRDWINPDGPVRRAPQDHGAGGAPPATTPTKPGLRPPGVKLPFPRRRLGRPRGARRTAAEAQEAASGCGEPSAREPATPAAPPAPRPPVPPRPVVDGVVATPDGAALDFRRPMRGTLDEHPLPLLVVAAGAAGATGTLKLVRGKVHKVVYIVEGHPIFVDSNLRNEALGEYLVQRGVIDEAQLAVAIKRAKAHSRKLGETLVKMELMDEQGVLAALLGQARIKLARALPWTDGAYTYLPGDDFSKRVPNCPIDPVELVLAALPKMTRADDLNEALTPRLDQTLRLTPLGEHHRDQIEQAFTPAALQRVTSGVSLRELLAWTSSQAGQALDRPTMLAQVEALRASGLATFVAAEPGAAAAAQPADGGAPAAPLPPAQPTPPPSPAEVEAVPVPVILLRQEDLVQPAPVVEPTSPPRPEPTLKLAPDAAPPSDLVIDPAEPSGVLSLEDLGRPAEPQRGKAADPTLELFEPGEQVPPPHMEPEDSGVLQIPITDDLELEEPPLPGAAADEEAPAVAVDLSLDLELEGAAAERVGAASPAAPPAPDEPGGADAGSPEADRLKEVLLQTYLGIHSKSYYEVLGLPADADAASVERAYREQLSTFSTDLLDQVDLGDEDDKLIEVNLIVKQAFTVLSDPLRRQHYDETLATAEAQPEPALDAFGAELYFQEGQVLLKQNDLEGAEQAFARAVRENPEQPDYLAFLGWALFLRRGRGEAGASAARPHLEHALQIASDAVKAHEFAGWIERDARNFEQAVEHLILALKIGPPRLDLFEAVKDLLGRLERHEELEHQYRRLIFRLRDTEPEKTIGLWVDLAYLYQQKLGQPDSAKVALQVAAKLSPSDPRVQAAIYAMDTAVETAAEPVDWRQVAEGHRQRLLRAPDDPGPLHDLVALHRAGRRKDQALAAAMILVHLGAATDAERELVLGLASRGLQRASRPLGAATLDQIRHPDDLPVVEQIVGLLSPVLTELYPVTEERYASSEDQRIEGGAGGALDALIGYAGQQLEVPLPPLYWSSALGPDLAPLPASKLRLLVGRELLQVKEPARIAFVAARALSCVGEGRRHIYGRRGTELKAAILATLTLCRAGVKIPDPGGEIERFRERVKASAVPMDRLRQLMAQLLAQDTRINLSQWIRAVRCTSARVGLLVCADLGVALAALDKDRATILDLIDFALGERYSQLRQDLGIAVSG